MTAPATSNWSFKRPVGTESVWQSPGRTGQQLTVKHISLSLSLPATIYSEAAASSLRSKIENRELTNRPLPCSKLNKTAKFISPKIQ